MPLHTKHQLIGNERAKKPNNSKRQLYLPVHNDYDLNSRAPYIINAMSVGNKEDLSRNPDFFLPLHRTLGNRAVGNLFRSKFSQPPREPDEAQQAALQNKSEMPKAGSEGKLLDAKTRSEMGSRFSHNFESVIVHTTKADSETAKSINSDAFTIDNHIYFGKGKYSPTTTEGKQLLAHELTHVVQQSYSPTSIPQLKESGLTSSNDPAERQAEEISKETMDEKVQKTSPETEIPLINLLGVSKFQDVGQFDKIDSFVLKQGGKAIVNARFGDIAEGQILVNKHKDEYKGKGSLQLLHHPLLPTTSAIASLNLEIDPLQKSEIKGNITFGEKNKKLSNLASKRDSEILELFGLRGLDLNNVPVRNEISNGNLAFGMENFSFSLGGILTGTGTLLAINDQITFTASADVKVPGLDIGRIDFSRNAEGIINGKGEVGVSLKKGKFTGNLLINYENGLISGQGKVGYKSEKFSGDVTLRLMDPAEATSLVNVESTSPSPEKSNKERKKGGYVIAGEGALDFAFNEWLKGTANVVVDPKGDVTVIGKITPAKEVRLFEEKPFRKDFPKFEARATYGLPVIGNIFLFAGVEFFLWAKLGPGLLRNIQIDGTYSTDPNVRKNYSIQASLNISAAAGATLRGEGGAGLEILDHDIKAGAGVNGTLGIKGYVEATPVIGYREEGEGNQDKKGVYFIRGDLELAAMPFFSLSGDVFIQLDSPWWSPAPDKTWKWDLGDKEWPLGGSLGIKASVEHIFGSNETPAIEFQSVDFSASKFMTDIMEEKTAPSGQAAAEKAGVWKEHNSTDAQVPAAAPSKTGVQEGGMPLLPPAKTPIEPMITKRRRTERPLPSEYETRGMSPADQKNAGENLEKKKMDVSKELEMKSKKKGGVDQKEKAQIDLEKEKVAKDKKEKLSRGLSAINQALEYAEESGIGLQELNRILIKIKKRSEYGFIGLYAEDEDTKFGIYAIMSKGQKIKELKKKEQAGIDKFWKEFYDPKELSKRGIIFHPEYHIPVLDTFINKQGSTLNIPMSYQPNSDKNGRTNRDRMKAGRAPIVPYKAGTEAGIDLHHIDQTFFSDLQETSREFHRMVGDDPEFHPYSLDPAYDSWRKLYGSYNNTIRDLGYIWNRIREKYWRRRVG